MRSGHVAVAMSGRGPRLSAFGCRIYIWMLCVLKGQGPDPPYWLLPAGVCLLPTLAALAYLSRALRAKAIA